MWFVGEFEIKKDEQDEMADLKDVVLSSVVRHIPRRWCPLFVGELPASSSKGGKTVHLKVD